MLGALLGSAIAVGALVDAWHYSSALFIFGAAILVGVLVFRASTSERVAQAIERCSPGHLALAWVVAGTLGAASILAFAITPTSTSRIEVRQCPERGCQPGLDVDGKPRESNRIVYVPEEHSTGDVIAKALLAFAVVVVPIAIVTFTWIWVGRWRHLATAWVLAAGLTGLFAFVTQSLLPDWEASQLSRALQNGRDFTIWDWWADQRGHDLAVALTLASTALVPGGLWIFTRRWLSGHATGHPSLPRPLRSWWGVLTYWVLLLFSMQWIASAILRFGEAAIVSLVPLGLGVTSAALGRIGRIPKAPSARTNDASSSYRDGGI